MNETFQRPKILEESEKNKGIACILPALGAGV